MGKGWRALVVYEYSTKSLGFSDYIGRLEPPIVDAATTVRTENHNEITIQINQALYKSDEDVSLITAFQVRYNGIIINMAPMQFNQRFHFGIFLLNEDEDDTVVDFMLKYIVVGAPIINPRNEDLDTLTVYKITSLLFWDL